MPPLMESSTWCAPPPRCVSGRGCAGDREQDAPRLQCALSWLLERLAEKTPHRVCGVRLLPFSLDAPIEKVRHVPGWTLRGRVYDVLEGIRLTLEEPVWGFETKVREGHTETR